jgi:hypothetical protein
MKKYITQKDKVKELFLKGKKLLKEKRTIINGQRVEVKWYEGFYTIEVIGNIVLYYIDENSDIVPYHSHFEVTNNLKYSLKNILYGSITISNAVIEGSDGTGKTTLVNYFATIGIMYQDRAVDYVSKVMNEEVESFERISKIKRFLTKDVSRVLVFLYVSCEEELWRRVSERGEMSVYDEKTLINQRLYLETYYILHNNHPNLLLIDTLNKDTPQIAEEVTNAIKEYRLNYEL